MRGPLLALALLVAAGLPGCASAAVPDPDDRDVEVARARDGGVDLARLRHGRGRFIARCSGCHPLPEPWTQPAERWPALVGEMTKRARLDPGDRRAVELYLVAVSSRPPSPAR